LQEDDPKSAETQIAPGLTVANSTHDPPVLLGMKNVLTVSGPVAGAVIELGPVAASDPTILGQAASTAPMTLEGRAGARLLSTARISVQVSPAPPSPPTDVAVKLNDPAPIAPPRKPAKSRTRARTKVGRAVLKNETDLALIGASFIALIDSKIEELGQKRPNSDEAKAAVNGEIADYEDLRRRVQAFLDAAAQFSTEKIKEKVVVNATTSVAEGIGNWWSKKHVQICDQTFQMGLFLSGVLVCSLAGAGGMLPVAICGAIAGGKPVVDAIKAARGKGRR
jgi:hypothetical protein